MTRRLGIVLVLSLLTAGAAPVLAGGGYHRGKHAHGIEAAAYRLEGSANHLHRSIDRARPFFVRVRLRHAEDAARDFEREARAFRRFVKHERRDGYRMARRFERVEHAYRRLHRELRHAPPTPWLRDELIGVRRRLAAVERLVYARSDYRDDCRGPRGPRYRDYDDDDRFRFDLHLPAIHGRIEWDD